MDLNLTGKTVLVTGASRGIGRAIAKLFHTEGAKVILVARDSTVLEQAAKDIGPDVHWIAADLSTDAGRYAVFEAAPSIDILVNNAGAIKRGPIGAVSMHDWHEGFDLKVWGYIHLCKLYATQMWQRRSGTMINIIGMGGRAVRPDYIIGSASNAALIGFTQALGAEAQAHGVRVFGINPAVTKTDRMVEGLKEAAQHDLGDAALWHEKLTEMSFPFDRPAQADEVAALAVLLASPKVQYLSGTVVDMDGAGQWRP